MNPVTLLRLGDADRGVLDLLRAELAGELGLPVVLSEATPDISGFFDQERLQFNSTGIVRLLHGMFAKDPPRAEVQDIRAPKVLGVLADDLFIPVLTFVFGEAQLGGTAAVVSYHRLQNERYGLPRDPARMMERLVKESLHELGHTFGLVHCMSQECVMHASTDVEDIDLKGDAFCRACKGAMESGRNDGVR